MAAQCQFTSSKLYLNHKSGSTGRERGGSTGGDYAKE